MIDWTRRDVLESTAVVGAALGTSAWLHDSTATATAKTAPLEPTVSLSIRVNGTKRVLAVDPRLSLADLLREELGLTGTKIGCNHGQCGACTVHVDGRRVLSCLTLAAVVQDREVSTIEGLAQGEVLHPVQQAFIDHDAFQCGACTPGQIMSATACIVEGHADTDANIAEYMSGNLCRCGAYPNILAAVRQAAGLKD